MPYFHNWYVYAHPPLAWHLIWLRSSSMHYSVLTPSFRAPPTLSTTLFQPEESNPTSSTSADGSTRPDPRQFEVSTVLYCTLRPNSSYIPPTRRLIRKEAVEVLHTVYSFNPPNVVYPLLTLLRLRKLSLLPRASLAIDSIEKSCSGRTDSCLSWSEGNITHHWVSADYYLFI